MDCRDGLSFRDSPGVAGMKLKEDAEGSRVGVRRVAISSNKSS